jgi:hypothetical protein
MSHTSSKQFFLNFKLALKEFFLMLYTSSLHRYTSNFLVTYNCDLIMNLFLFGYDYVLWNVEALAHYYVG